MEPLGNRFLSIIALAIVLAMLGSGFAFTKMADDIDNTPQVHCSFHGQTIACAPAKAA